MVPEKSPNTKESQKFFFDAKYAEKSQESFFSRFYKDRLNISDLEIARMFGRLKLTESSLVLDIGCGDQPLCSIYATEAACSVVGVDVSLRGLRTAKTNASKSGFLGSFEAVVADLDHLPFKGECFDAIIHSMVLEHIDNPEVGISEASMILKYEGRIFLYTVNKKYPFRRFYDILSPKYSQDMVHSKDRYYDIHDIWNLLGKNNIKVESEAYLFILITAIWDLILLQRFSQLLIRKPWIQAYRRFLLPFFRVIALFEGPLKRLGCSSSIIIIGRK